MDGQISIFDYLNVEEKYELGQLVDSSACGEELSFEQVVKMVGEKVLLVSHPTSNYTFYEVIKIVGCMRYEYVPGKIGCDGKCRFIYDDGTNQKGYVSEDYLNKEKYPHYGEIHKIITL